MSEQEERPALTQSEEDVLTLIALGFTNKNIGRRLDMTPDAVGDAITALSERFGLTGGKIHAVIWAFDKGVLKPDDFLDESMIGGIAKLTAPRQHKVMRIMISNHGKFNSNGDIAEKMRTTEANVRSLIRDVFAAMGAQNRLDAAINYYVFAKR